MSTTFCQLDIREQVQRAQALADIAIPQGLDGHSATSPDNDVEVMAGALAGCQEWLRTHDFDADDDELIVGNLIAAARAIGIAQGLRLRPELFTKQE
jgi:hypothetical protein